MHFTFAVVSRYSFVFLAPKGERRREEHAHKNTPHSHHTHTTHTPHSHTHMLMQLHRPHSHTNTRIVAIAREIDFLNANALHMSDGMRLEKSWKNVAKKRKKRKESERRKTTKSAAIRRVPFSPAFLLLCK